MLNIGGIITEKDVEEKLKSEGINYRKETENNLIYYIDNDKCTILTLGRHRGNAGKKIRGGYLANVIY